MSAHAVLATVSESRTDALLDEGKAVASALTSGYHVAFWIGAGLVLVALAVAATVLKPVPKEAMQAHGEEEPALTEAA